MQLFQTNIFFNLLSVILGTHPWPLSVAFIKASSGNICSNQFLWNSLVWAVPVEQIRRVFDDK